MTEARAHADGGQLAGTALFQGERHEFILERVRKYGRVEVAALAAALGVTGETIRRDLAQLQSQHLVRRQHGGAVPWREWMFEPNLAIRESHNIDEKRRIAGAAVEEVPESGSVLIDSGSTALRLADVFPRDRSLTVFTNSLPIARSLAISDKPEVVMLGGTLRRRTMACVDESGPWALQDINVDVLFFSCDAVSLERGFSTPDRSEVALKQAMMRSARRSVMMLDHSKFREDQRYKYASIGDVDVIITDAEVGDSTAARLQEMGPRVMRV